MTKIINLIPVDRRTRGTAAAGRSLLATIAILISIWCVAWIVQSPPARAQNLAQAARQRRYQAQIDDLAALSLTRATSWLPWDELLAAMTRIPHESIRLRSLTYESHTGEVLITGEMHGVEDMAEFMYELSNFDWLDVADPNNIEKDPQTGLTRFRVRVPVVPLLIVEEQP